MSDDKSNGRPWEDQGNDGWGRPLADNSRPDDLWMVPEYHRRAVEMVVRQVLRLKAGIYADGIVDVIGSFVGGRLRGRARGGWFISGSRLRCNPYRNASD